MLQRLPKQLGMLSRRTQQSPRTPSGRWFVNQAVWTRLPRKKLMLTYVAPCEGIVLGVISNHLGFWFHEECATPCGLRDLVSPELLLVSSEVGCSKPGNRIFELFLERLHVQHPGLTAADCIFVDDKVDNVTAAQALGFQGLCFNAKTAAPGALAEDLKKAGVPLP
mmetsp:Transcript_41283/g.84976  ORF Transcript_41283/g.84976 Transcript_41283/m.84976 type:complete len:166 (+) Transcript_41283:143-640(+)